LKKAAFLVSFSLLVLTVGVASAQQLDLAFGMGTVNAPSASNQLNGFYPVESLTGGAYPSFSGDFLLFKNFGVGGEIAWRASQALYAGYQPYRPLFWDFDGMWVPRISKHAAAEFSAGIGAESIRFYTNYYNCNYIACTNYYTSTHFMGQFGAGLKLYVHGGIFVRPEAHLYLVNNNVEFSSSHAVRYGGSIGYTFGGNH
jgi:hypothetical protein